MLIPPDPQYTDTVQVIPLLWNNTPVRFRCRIWKYLYTGSWYAHHMDLMPPPVRQLPYNVHTGRRTGERPVSSAYETNARNTE